MLIRKEDYDSTLNRFYNFADGVIRSINLSFYDDGSKLAEIVVACRDSEAMLDDGWVTVRFRIREVKEFKTSDGPKTTLQVLSSGMHFRNYDDKVGVEFGGAFESPSSLEELRESDAYAIGEEVDIEVGKY